MEEELKCQFCDQFFTDPVILPCFHSACLSCVERSVESVSLGKQKSREDGHPMEVVAKCLEGVGLKGSRPVTSSASATSLRCLDHGLDGGRRRMSLCSDINVELRGKLGTQIGILERLSLTGHRTSSASSCNGSNSTLFQPMTGEEGDEFNHERDFGALDLLSVASETDSGVVCNGHSRSSSCASSPAANLCSCESSKTLRLFCRACNNFVPLNHRGVAGLVKNRALETLVEKYTFSQKPPTECQLCENDSKTLAVVTCEQCEVSYCQACLEKCHPMRGPLAKHCLVPTAEGPAILKAKLKNALQKCTEHRDESLTTFCVTCQVPVCCLCIHSGQHANHCLQSTTSTCKAHKAELSQLLHKLSEKARSASDFLQQLKTLKHDIKENSLEFEALVVAKCDALIEAVKACKCQLLGRIDHERKYKEEVFGSQIALYTAKLQRTAGLLQVNIELLKETDSTAFLQISRGLINRVTEAEHHFHKTFPLELNVLPTFDMHLDSEPILNAVQSLSFYHKKAPCRPLIIKEECSAEQNSVTVSWQLPESSSAAADGYILELAEASNSEFQEAFRGTESLCLVEGLHFNTMYLGRVKAYNHGGHSQYSECISLQTAKVAWFTFDPTSAHPDVSLMNGNRTAWCSSTDSCIVLGSVGLSRGVHYWEFLIDQFENNSDPAFGIARFDVERDQILGKTDRAWSMYIDNNRSWFMHSGVHHTRREGGIQARSTVGVLLDLDNHSLSFYTNNKPRALGVAFMNLRGVFYPAVSINRNVRVTLNSGIEPPFNFYETD